MYADFQHVCNQPINTVPLMAVQCGLGAWYNEYATDHVMYDLSFAIQLVYIKSM